MSELRIEDPLADEAKVIEQLQAMARARRTSPGVDLIKLAQETKSPRIRNEVALVFLAVDTPKACKVIVELLKRTDTKGTRGTLLYVLNEMNESVPLQILTDIIISDTYEAQEEAISLLRKSKPDDKGRAAAAIRLRPFTQSTDQHMSLLAAEALDILGQD